MTTRRKIAAVGQSPSPSSSDISSSSSSSTARRAVTKTDDEESSSSSKSAAAQTRDRLLLRDSVILKFGHGMAILYWSYRVLILTHLGARRAENISSSGSTILRRDDINFELNGGFCPATLCPIIGTGPTSIRDVRTEKSDWTSTTINTHNNNNNNTNNNNELITTNVNDSLSFQMYIRDPKSDTYISGLLSTGQKHDPKIQNLIIRTLGRGGTRSNNNAPLLFVDIGANIGYFTATALAIGARTISFEPYYYNAMTLLSTINLNAGSWGDRSTLYMNTLGYESNRVTMKSTNDKINNSNMHITGNTCRLEQQHHQQRHGNHDDEEYGIEYMDEVSLDQVLLLNRHQRHHRAVTLMKIDVETYEIHVLNGAMYSLCNIIIERIVMEVEYLKPSYNLNNQCSFDTMRRTLLRLGYDIFDVEEEMVYTNDVHLQELPSDILFRLNDFTQSPATRLRGSVDNPCAKFDLTDTK